MKFSFEPSGEPPVGEDVERPEEYEAEHHWDKQNRPSWQKHSESGPNIEPEGKGDAKPPPTFEELVNPLHPPKGKEYDRHWNRRNYDREHVYAEWHELGEKESDAYTETSKVWGGIFCMLKNT